MANPARSTTAANPYHQPLGPVSDLVATTTPRPALQSVEVNWTPPSGERLIDHYIVYAAHRPDFDAETADLVTEAPVSRFVHTSLGPAPETWHYRVVGIDAAGNVARFAESPRASATTAQGFVVGASASSQYSADYAPEFAVDGSLNSRWAAQQHSDDEWIQVDLAAPITSGQVELHWQGAYAVDYDLLVSPDGDTWTVVHSVRDKPDAAADAVDIDSSAAFSHVRMHGMKRATNWGFSLWEFWVTPAQE